MEPLAVHHHCKRFKSLLLDEGHHGTCRNQFDALAIWLQHFCLEIMDGGVAAMMVPLERMPSSLVSRLVALFLVSSRFAFSAGLKFFESTDTTVSSGTPIRDPTFSTTTVRYFLLLFRTVPASSMQSYFVLSHRQWIDLYPILSYYHIVIVISSLVPSYLMDEDAE